MISTLLIRVVGENPTKKLGNHSRGPIKYEENVQLRGEFWRKNDEQAQHTQVCEHCEEIFSPKFSRRWGLPVRA